MSQTLSKAVSILAVFLVGFMAGLMFGTGMDQYTHRLLSASAWVTEHQVMDALSSRPAPTVECDDVIVGRGRGTQPR